MRRKMVRAESKMIRAKRREREGEEGRKASVGQALEVRMAGRREKDGQRAQPEGQR